MAGLGSGMWAALQELGRDSGESKGGKACKGMR